MTHGDGKTAEIEIATDAPVRMRQRTMMRFLWGTVIVAIVIPLVLVLAAMLRARTETAPEVPPTLFAQFVGVAGQKAAEQTVTQVNALLDAVYTPVDTQFLKDAAAEGLQVMSGYELFFYQGLHAYQIFHGRPMDEAALRAALREG